MWLRQKFGGKTIFFEFFRKKKKRTTFFFEKMELETVIGNTVERNSRICGQGDKVCYVAGSVVVVYSIRNSKQERFLRCSLPNDARPFSCVAMSDNGRYVAAGQSGKDPLILVFDVASGKQICRMAPFHSYGVGALSFSSESGRYLFSVGYHHDSAVALWDWRRAIVPIASGRCSAKILSASSVDCASSSSSSSSSSSVCCFVTVGVRSVKYWSLVECSGDTSLPMRALDSRSAKLSRHHRDMTFTDVVCVGGRTFASTNHGLLVMIDANRVLKRALKLKAATAFALSASGRYVTCACADGIVRVFGADEHMQFVCTLPRPPPLVASSGGDARAQYADAIGVQMLDACATMTVYSDRSMYLWDTSNPARPAKSRGFLSHSGAVLDVKSFGVGGFASASADGSVRFWSTAEAACSSAAMTNCRTVWPNGDAAALHAEPALFKCASASVFVDESELPRSARVQHPSAPVLRLAVNARATELAAGDRDGNVHLYALPSLERVAVVRAHDGQVRALAYSPDGSMLATGSRDRLVHVFALDSAEKGEPRLLKTLSDHSGAVLSLCFAGANRLVSAGADKSLVVRTLAADGSVSQRANLLTSASAGVSALSTVAAHPLEASTAVAPIGASRVSVINLATMHGVASPLANDTNSELCSALYDSVSGAFVAVTRSDNRIDLHSVDVRSRHIDALPAATSASGHSERVTSLFFADSGDTLVSASQDGTIMQWRLPSAIVAEIRERRHGIVASSSSQVDSFCVGALPTWAQQATGVDGAQQSSDNDADTWTSGSAWAERLDSAGFGAFASTDDAHMRRFTIDPHEPSLADTDDDEPFNDSDFENVDDSDEYQVDQVDRVDEMDELGVDGVDQVDQVDDGEVDQVDEVAESNESVKLVVVSLPNVMLTPPSALSASSNVLSTPPNVPQSPAMPSIAMPMTASPDKLDHRQRHLADEVERTRQRLIDMGILPRALSKQIEKEEQEVGEGQQDEEQEQDDVDQQDEVEQQQQQDDVEQQRDEQQGDVEQQDVDQQNEVEQQDEEEELESDGFPHVLDDELPPLDALPSCEEAEAMFADEGADNDEEDENVCDSNGILPCRRAGAEQVLERAEGAMRDLMQCWAAEQESMPTPLRGRYASFFERVRSLVPTPVEAVRPTEDLAQYSKMLIDLAGLLNPSML
jgi:WD40 repeat protein